MIGMRYFFTIAPLLLLAACATLSEDECRGGDWFAIGQEDGTEGRKLSFLQQHSEACGEFGVAPDRSAYLQGREAGLKFYCTPDSAFREGRRGSRLSAVCPAGDLARLQRANQRGLDVHRIEDEIDDIEREIRQINAEIAALPAGDPGRASLASERSFLRLDILRLRARRARLL